MAAQQSSAAEELARQRQALQAQAAMDLERAHQVRQGGSDGPYAGNKARYKTRNNV